MPNTRLHPASTNILGWVSIKEAAQILGKNFSEESIRRKIKKGQWKPGIHWVDVGAGEQRRSYKINIEAAKNMTTWG